MKSNNTRSQNAHTRAVNEYTQLYENFAANANWSTISWDEILNGKLDGDNQGTFWYRGNRLTAVYDKLYSGTCTMDDFAYIKNNLHRISSKGLEEQYSRIKAIVDGTWNYHLSDNLDNIEKMLETRSIEISDTYIKNIGSWLANEQNTYIGTRIQAKMDRIGNQIYKILNKKREKRRRKEVWTKMPNKILKSLRNVVRPSIKKIGWATAAASLVACLYTGFSDNAKESQAFAHTYDKRPSISTTISQTPEKKEEMDPFYMRLKRKRDLSSKAKENSLFRHKLKNSKGSFGTNALSDGCSYAVVDERCGEITEFDNCNKMSNERFSFRCNNRVIEYTKIGSVLSRLFDEKYPELILFNDSIGFGKVKLKKTHDPTERTYVITRYGSNLEAISNNTLKVNTSVA